MICWATIPISEIAAEVGASERTVRRDITELQDADFDVDVDVTKRENRAIATLVSERNYSPISITKRERFTLLAVRNVFDVLKGTPFHEDIHSVMSKLDQRASEKERSEVISAGERLVYLPDHGTKSYAGKEDIIDAIQTGMLSRKLVRYRYSAGRGRSGDGYLAPYGMALYRHGLYVVGARLKDLKDDNRDDIRVFAIERFTDAEHLRSHDFVLPPEFQMRNVLHGSFGPHLVDESGPSEVVVEFSREKAHLVSTRSWHETQQVEVLSTGRVRLTIPSSEPRAGRVVDLGMGTARSRDLAARARSARDRRTRRCTSPILIGRAR
jgi:proteasome accessory factor B